MTDNRRFTVVRRPEGLPRAEDFAHDTVPVPALGTGEVLIRNRYASLDPAIRGWLSDAPSYMPPIPLGAPVRATTVGEVVASTLPDFAPGDWVMGLNAIEEYSVAVQGGFTMKIDPGAVPSVTNYLSVLGAVGLTAYFGTIEVAKVQAGETLLVSGAAGAVGSLVGQIGRILGARTVGLAGGPDKCRRLIEDYGYDAAINYRGKSADELTEEIAKAAPDGIDAIFENVGGAGLEAGLKSLNKNARVALCGLISEYNNAEGAVGIRNLWQVIVKTATLHGFLISDFVPRFAEGGAAMAGWLAEGKLRFDEHVDHGIDNALPAFLRLFEGSNQGKMILGLG